MSEASLLVFGLPTLGSFAWSRATRDLTAHYRRMAMASVWLEQALADTGDRPLLVVMGHYHQSIVFGPYLRAALLAANTIMATTDQMYATATVGLQERSVLLPYRSTHVLEDHAFDARTTPGVPLRGLTTH